MLVLNPALAGSKTVAFTATPFLTCKICGQPDHNRVIASPFLKLTVQPREDLLTDHLIWDTESVQFALARTTLLNSRKEVVYDTYVYDSDRPVRSVICSTYKNSGIEMFQLQPEHGATESADAKKIMLRLMKGRTIITHAGKNELAALGVHQAEFAALNLRGWRDTQLCTRFQRTLNNYAPGPSLKKLYLTIGGKYIQSGRHDSVEDTVATWECYLSAHEEIDSEQAELHLEFDQYIRGTWKAAVKPGSIRSFVAR